MGGDEVARAAMLILARESRGITQAELAQLMTRNSDGTAVSQGYISKAEAGRLEVTGPRLSHCLPLSRRLQSMPDTPKR